MGIPRRLTTLLAIFGLLGAGVAEAHTRLHAPRSPRRPVPVIVLGKPHPAPAVAVIDGTEPGMLDLNVKPRTTEVWVNGTLHGTCDSFDGYPAKLTLSPGLYRIRLVTPDGIDVARDLRVRAGVELNVALDLR